MNQNNIRISNFNITTGDGVALAASEYTPAQSNGTAILVSPAMAIPRSYYQHFCSWLAEQGALVLCYDYRGMGDNKVSSHSLNLEDFGRQDMAAAIQYLADHYPDKKLVTIGHSLGGQILGLAENNGLAEKSLVIASGSGFWKLYSGKLKLRMWLAMFVLMPMISRLLGHFPGKLLGGGDDLPAAIARRWAHWCRSHGYVSDLQGRPLRPYYDQQKHIRFVSIKDDTDFAPMACVQALKSFYNAEKSELLLLDPADYQVRKIGHFGFFRRNMPEQLWLDTLEWLWQEPAAEAG